MSTSVDWDRLDVAAFRVSMKRSVSRIAWYATIVGPPVAFLGFKVGFVPLGAIGCVLACAGVWNLTRPSVTGLAVDGAARVLIGVITGLSWLWLEDKGSSSTGKWIVGGVFAVVWGIRRLSLYRTARRTVNDPDAIARLETLVRDVSRRNSRDDASIAEFRTGRFHLQRNRLALYDVGVIALLEHQVVRLERRTDIWIESSGSASLGSSLKVRIQMGDLQLQGVMTAEHFERFERWKLGTAPARPIAA